MKRIPEPTGPVLSERTCKRCKWEWPDEDYYFPLRGSRDRKEHLCRSCFNDRCRAAKCEVPEYLKDNVVNMLATWGGNDPDRVENYLRRAREIRARLGMDCDDLDVDAPITNPKRIRHSGTPFEATPRQIERVLSLWHQGMQIGLISARTGVPVSTIKRMARRRGLKHPGAHGCKDSLDFFEDCDVRTFRVSNMSRKTRMSS